MHLYKNQRSNVLVERINQVIYKNIVTKDLDIKVYYCIDPQEGNLALVS